jgi:uracil-DNA glycosylase
MDLAPVWRSRAARVAVGDAGASPSEAGAPGVPDAIPAHGPMPAAAVERPAPPPRGEGPTAAPVPDVRASEVACMGWQELESAIAACRACGLHAGRRQAVPGVGDRSARWLFVGEGPGAEEDAKGEPFVGQAGRLLDNMLKSIGLARGQEVYIANVVKCRPPQNRTPTPEEAGACLPFLHRQIELIAPALIVALGKTAILGLLGTDAPMSALRGRVHRYRDIPVIVTYHPAYLLRKPVEKAKTWEDLCLALDTQAALQPARTDPI